MTPGLAGEAGDFGDIDTATPATKECWSYNSPRTAKNGVQSLSADDVTYAITVITPVPPSPPFLDPQKTPFMRCPARPFYSLAKFGKSRPVRQRPANGSPRTAHKRGILAEMTSTWSLTSTSVATRPDPGQPLLGHRLHLVEHTGGGPAVPLRLGQRVPGRFLHQDRRRHRKSPRQSLPGARATVVHNVELFYNKSTGELYPLLPQDAAPHTCVWTIWGDHGSDTKLVTEKPFISAATHASIRSNNFLPPRMPIYVTCVDWQNTTYRGSFGAYR